MVAILNPASLSFSPETIAAGLLFAEAILKGEPGECEWYPDVLEAGSLAYQSCRYSRDDCGAAVEIICEAEKPSLY